MKGESFEKQCKEKMKYKSEICYLSWYYGKSIIITIEMYMLNYLELFKFHDSISFDDPTECIYISKIEPQIDLFIYMIQWHE